MATDRCTGAFLPWEKHILQEVPPPTHHFSLPQKRSTTHSNALETSQVLFRSSSTWIHGKSRRSGTKRTAVVIVWGSNRRAGTRGNIISFQYCVHYPPAFVSNFEKKLGFVSYLTSDKRFHFHVLS